MGSIDKACISGFLCRLCSEMHRTVIHIYGDQGKRLGLVEKINGYLPITISPTDPLPKTICQSCLRRVEQHYDLLLRLSRIKEGRCLRIYKSVNRDGSNASEDDYLTEEQIRRNNPNGPFIIASTSLSAAANVSRSSPTTLSTRVHEINQSSAHIQEDPEGDDEEEEEEDGNGNNDDGDGAEEDMAGYEDVIDDDEDEDDIDEVDEVDEDDIDEEDEEDNNDNTTENDEGARNNPDNNNGSHMQYDLENGDNVQRNALTVQTNGVDVTAAPAIPLEVEEEEQEVIEDGIIDMERVEEEIIND